MYEKCSNKQINSHVGQRGTILFILNMYNVS